MFNHHPLKALALLLALSLLALPAAAQRIFEDGFEDEELGSVFNESLTCTRRGLGNINCGTADFDGDGLPDCYEEALGTSPQFVDSDGDTLTDFEEIFTYFFDPDTNPYRFNPRIADVPLLNIDISDVPKIRVRYTTSAGSEETVSSEESVSQSEQITSSSSLSLSVGMEVSQTVGVEAGTSGVNGSVESSITGSWETTATLSQEVSRGYNETFSRARSATEQTGVTNTGGEILVTVDVTNAGNLALVIDDLVLSVGELDLYPLLRAPSSEALFQPIGAMQADFDLSSGISLAGGDTAPDLIFAIRDLNLDDTLGLLRDARNLQIKTGVVNVSNPETNRSFDAAFNTINGATAQVVIDYGPNLGFDKFYVSTVGSPDRRISLRDALCDTLALDVGAADSMVARVNSSGVGQVPVSITANTLRNRTWQLVHISAPSNGVVTFFDPKQGYDLDNIELRAGQSIYLSVAEDDDGDGLLARQELLYGSGSARDTDQDGLDDGFEVLQGWIASYDNEPEYQVYSSPINADRDRDGFTDPQERDNQTDPNRADFNPDRTARKADDFNGDGLSDLLIGAFRTNVSGFVQAGSVYNHQFYGESLAPLVTPVNPGALSQSDAWFGLTMTVGHYNRDAYADAVIGVPLDDPEGIENAGGIRVVFGSESGLDIGGAMELNESLLSPAGSASIPQPNDLFGVRMTSGDFNNDGFDDFAIGVPADDVGQADSGRVYVISGSANFESSNPQALLISQAELFGGVEADDRLGEWVKAGDFNGDGFDDLAMAASFENGAGSSIDAGEVDIVYGSSEGLLLSTAQRIRQSVIPGQLQESNDLFGVAIVTADFNRDGFDDAVVSAPGEDGGRGALFLLLGSAEGLSRGPSPGRLLRRGETGEALGRKLEAGDFNDDGWLDLVSAQWSEDQIRIFYGGEGDTVLPNQPAMLTEANFENADGDGVGPSTSASFGDGLWVGDYNNDGIDDLVVGAPRNDSRQDPQDSNSAPVADVGRAYVIFGRAGAGLQAVMGEFRVLDHPAITNPLEQADPGVRFGRTPQ